jgi:hypothetical protein
VQNTYPKQHVQQQGQQQQQQQQGKVRSSQPQMTYEALTASLVSMVRNGLPPESAAKMLQQLQPHYQQSTSKPSRLAAAPTAGEGHSSAQAGGVVSAVVQQDMRAGSSSVNAAARADGSVPGAGTKSGIVQAVPQVVCFPNLPQQLLPRSVSAAVQQQPQQQHIPVQLLSRAQRHQQHTAQPPQKRQQQQTSNHQAKQQQQQLEQHLRQPEHRQDSADVADEFDDHAALLQHINGFEEAVCKLTGRSCSPPNSSQQQQDGGVPSNMDMQPPARAEPTVAPGPSSAQQQIAPVRDRRFKAIKNQLEQAADRTQMIEDIKSKAYVDLDGLLRGTTDTGSPLFAVAGQRRSSAGSVDRIRPSTPTHPEFAQAAKQNECALLADAAEAVLANREPHVRAAIAQYGGARRVISAADLQSTHLGKQVLAVLQKLLLIPRGDMPAGAQIIFEVALPEPGDAPAAPAAPAGAAAGVSAAGAGAAALVDAAQQQAPAAAAPVSIDLTLDGDEPHAGEANAGMQTGAAGAAPSAAVSPFAAAVAAAIAAATAAAATEDLGGVLDQPMSAGLSSNPFRSNAGATAGAAVAAVHADARLDAAMPSQDILAALLAGSKRSRTEEQQQQQQHEDGHVVPEPDQPPAKRTYRAELYL